MDNRQHVKKTTPSRASVLAAKAAALVPNLFQNTIGQALPYTYFHGIDPDDTQKLNALARRRAKNKVARASRRKNRSVR